MNPFLRLPLYPALCCCLLLVSLPVLAMSPIIEDAANITSSDHSSALANSNPEQDARAELAKGDLRLLGFAQRVTSVPGVEATDRQAAMDACGVRLMKGFGDVIRTDKDSANMRLAYDYAKRYNAVVIEACLRKD